VKIGWRATLIRSIRMHKAIAAAILSIGLAACGIVGTFVDGIEYANAVEDHLEQLTGLKPGVGFNFNNGRLQSVTVTFPRLYDGKPLRDLAEATRAAVKKEFKQTPENIVLAFALGKGAADAAAQVEQTH
jgi:hypothetical protein